MNKLGESCVAITDCLPIQHFITHVSLRKKCALSYTDFICLVPLSAPLPLAHGSSLSHSPKPGTMRIRSGLFFFLRHYLPAGLLKSLRQ